MNGKWDMAKWDGDSKWCLLKQKDLFRKSE